MERLLILVPANFKTLRVLHVKMLAGKLKDGSLMPLVVTREWTNRYWALLTELAFPGTNLSLRSKRPMSSLHPKEEREGCFTPSKYSIKIKKLGAFLKERKYRVSDDFI